jgi:hypothetical protein
MRPAFPRKGPPRSGASGGRRAPWAREGTASSRCRAVTAMRRPPGQWRHGGPGRSPGRMPPCVASGPGSRPTAPVRPRPRARWHGWSRRGRGGDRPGVSWPMPPMGTPRTAWRVWRLGQRGLWWRSGRTARGVGDVWRAARCGGRRRGSTPGLAGRGARGAGGGGRQAGCASRLGRCVAGGGRGLGHVPRAGWSGSGSPEAGRTRGSPLGATCPWRPRWTSWPAMPLGAMPWSRFRKRPRARGAGTRITVVWGRGAIGTPSPSCWPTACWSGGRGGNAPVPRGRSAAAPRFPPRPGRRRSTLPAVHREGARWLRHQAVLWWVTTDRCIELCSQRF